MQFQNLKSRLLYKFSNKNIYYTILRYFNAVGADKKNRSGLIQSLQQI